MKGRMDRWAKLSLLLALGLALLGVVLRESGSTGVSFVGGLLLAFGEAALVGGLADWFAVRALFEQPMGLPIPHTAIIPRNRRRIVEQVRQLVLNEWLPKSVIVERLETFDFVGTSVAPLLETAEPHVRGALRALGRDLLAGVDPRPLAETLARLLGGAAEANEVRLFLAELVARARDQGWLEPLLRSWVVRLQEWAESPRSRAVIHERLERAAGAYRRRDLLKTVTFHVAEIFGGIDMEEAADVLQREIRQFAADQLGDRSQLQEIVRDGLTDLERRLREEPAFLEDIRRFVAEAVESGTLTRLTETTLEAVRREGLRLLDEPDSPLLAWTTAAANRLLERVVTDQAVRSQVNAWCRRLAVDLAERHHGTLGTLVEEQLNKLSDERLTRLIEERVGEDLNWIRLNGTFVGGLIGVGLYLMFLLVKLVL
jgi:uncharacterized membrane-anchored protein YjiN (DUF445 family)